MSINIRKLQTSGKISIFNGGSDKREFHTSSCSSIVFKGLGGFSAGESTSESLLDTNDLGGATVPSLAVIGGATGGGAEPVAT